MSDHRKGMRKHGDKVRAETLAAIVAYRRSHGYSPTLRDLVDMTSIKSTSHASSVVRRLAEKGEIAYTAGIARSITIKES